MRQIQVTAAVEGVHELLIHFIAGVQTEAHKVERRRNYQFKTLVSGYPAGEFLCQPDMFPDMKLQALDSVVAEHKPQLESPKTAAERDMPVAVIDNRARLRRSIAQV